MQSKEVKVALKSPGERFPVSFVFAVFLANLFSEHTRKDNSEGLNQSERSQGGRALTQGSAVARGHA